MKMNFKIADLLKKTFDNRMVFVLPVFYFFVNFINIWCNVPYSWYGEVTMMFFLVILFLYAEINSLFKTSFSHRAGSSILANSVCLNVILLFTINCFYILFLRFYVAVAPVFDYNISFYTETLYFGSTVVIDSIRFFISFLFIVSMWFSLAYTKLKKDISFEFYGLMGVLCAFVLMGVSCKNLFLFFLIIEAISFLLIGLVCFSKTRTSFEVALKFFILSGMFTLIGLLGCVIIYGSLRTLDYRALKFICSSISVGAIDFSYNHLIFLNLGVVFVFIAILFKLGSFPFHVYVADYSSESIYPLMFFFLVPLKVMFFFVLTVLFATFSHMQYMSAWLFLFCGLSSIIVGAKSAVSENEIKKFLAFTSINQFGFALLSLSVPSFLAIAAAFVFVVVYCASMIVFMYVPMRSFGKNNREAFLFLNHFAYYNYFSARKWSINFLTPFSASFNQDAYKNSAIVSREKFGAQFRFIFIIFSLIGIPPLPGFGAKFLIFFVLMYHHHTTVVLFVLLVSLISAYYYLNLIYKMFNKSESSTFVLSENYFKFVKSKSLDLFHAVFTLLFFCVSFVILDVSVFFCIADILMFVSF